MIRIVRVVRTLAREELSHCRFRLYLERLDRDFMADDTRAAALKDFSIAWLELKIELIRVILDR